MHVVYHIQRLEGHVNGKPSWMKLAASASEKLAREMLAAYREHQTTRNFRVRKIKRK